ncbi:hypothetical protein LCGC14_0245210 [marine sediment metagenome]|uniref:Glycosyltransferase family 9 (Heptosyltransferase) n=1 Tax=marine sediment metagenome TaxID=412755 RepID=A0A0F9UBA6_9ZZZZ
MFLLTGLQVLGWALFVTRILLTRLGGAGDMLMTEPILRALHDKYAPCYITYRTHRHVYDLMLYHPLIDEILCTRTGCWDPTPEGYDVHVNLHGVIERAPFGQHGIDAFAEAAGVTLERRQPKLYLDGTMCPVRTEDDRYPEISHPEIKAPPTVDISFHIPQEPRNKAWESGRRVISRFMEFMDSHGQHPLVRMVGQDHMEPGRSHMLKMANEIQCSRLFVGPDSGGFHIAAALGVPTVASFTNRFPAKMRSYPKVVAAGDDLDEVFALTLALHRKNNRNGN